MFASMYGLVSPNGNVSKNINHPVEYGAGKAGLNQMVKYFPRIMVKNIRIMQLFLVLFKHN